MKIRFSYVSNSSSSSFVINDLNKLSPDILDKIVNYDERFYEYCIANGIAVEEFDSPGYSSHILGGKQYFNETSGVVCGTCINNECRWEFNVDTFNNRLVIYTFLDNFDMHQWLNILGVEFTSGDDEFR